MLTKSMLEHLALRRGIIFPRRVYLSTSITGTSGEQKILMLSYLHSYIPQKSWFGLLCPKDHRTIFRTPNDYYNAISGHSTRIYGNSKCFGVSRNMLLLVQHGNRPYRTAEVFSFLSDCFDNRVITLELGMHKRNGMDWTLYSPNLTFFLWEYLNEQIYRHNPQTVGELKKYIWDHSGWNVCTGVWKLCSQIELSCCWKWWLL